MFMWPFGPLYKAPLGKLLGEGENRGRVEVQAEAAQLLGSLPLSLACP